MTLQAPQSFRHPSPKEPYVTRRFAVENEKCNKIRPGICFLMSEY